MMKVANKGFGQTCLARADQTQKYPLQGLRQEIYIAMGKINPGTLSICTREYV